MAFDISNFSKSSADYAGGTEQFKYDSEDDKLTIQASGYFNDALNGFTIVSGSLINIKAIDGEFLALMTNTVNVITLTEIAVNAPASTLLRSIDFNISSLNSPAGPNSPSDPTLDGFIRSYEFNLNDILYIDTILPADYKAGTDMRVRINVTTSNTDTGFMNWNLDYRVKNIGDIITGGTITVGFLTIIPNGNDNELFTTDALPISGATAVPKTTQINGIIKYVTAAGYTGTPRITGINLEYEAAY